MGRSSKLSSFIFAIVAGGAEEVRGGIKATAHATRTGAQRSYSRGARDKATGSGQDIETSAE